MLKSRFYLLMVVLGVVALLAGACAKPAPTPSPAPAPSPEPAPTPAALGTVKVYVTDAPPGDRVTSIMVTVSKIEIHKAAAEQEQQQTQQGGGEWITIDISGNATTFDLLKISGIEEFLGASQVEAGKYTQVRLTIDNSEVTLGDKEPQAATVPSKELKLVRPFDVVAGETTDIILDFDADKSVTVTGADKIIVKPVVKLTVR